MTGTGKGAGTAGPVDAAQLRARQEQSRQRIAAVQARALDAKAALAHETATATSTDRSVTVTVNPGGALVGLAFGPSAQKLPLPALARTVLAAYGQASGAAAAHTQALLRDMLGDDAGAALAGLAASAGPNLPNEGKDR